MFFQPVTGVGGYAGWRILENTAPQQREVFDKSPTLQTNIDYFRDNIEKAQTIDGLMDDRRLLTVVLGAFGLADEINKGGLVRKILEEGTEDERSFANRFNDPRYIRLAEVFSYGDSLGIGDVTSPEFQEDIIARYKVQEFERAVGETDNDMRLALNFKREIAEFADPALEERTAWLRLMAQEPLKQLMTTALNIPTSVDQLDVSRQQEIFAEKAEQLFGSSSLTIFEDPEKIDEAIRRFFLSRQLQNGPSETTPGTAALSLLQTTSGLGAASTIGLILSQQ